ncbi:hypothetical protein [Haloarcula sp. Atlit-7R]|uniref:hypothetical protein n=1 Tax=Haloarcula sp. Atlit-7R TaxID=2282125 RepID=UPI001F2CFA77|nr:hypothetical protein [Haloarcula sp. Atlit-7R]
MTVETRPNAPDVEEEGNLELLVTAGSRPWATYTASISRDGDDTVVDIGWISDRRFGFR